MIEYTVKVYKDGSKHWFKDNQLHREDGPALEYANGSKCWYRYDQRHREDGPAIEHSTGNRSWYLNGINISEEEFLRRTNPIPPELQVIKDLRVVAEKHGYKLTKEGE